MCSEYQTKTTPKDIIRALGVPVIDNAGNFEWGKPVKMFSEAPVIARNATAQLEMSLSTFPASPLPNARLSALEGQTDGPDDKDLDTVQIKRIYETKRWKEGIESHPVVIPGSRFLEFAYWGPHFGDGMSFRIPDEPVMFIAGIRFNAFKPKVFGHALLTHTATEQMLEIHHRLVVLLRTKHVLGYLEPMSAKDRFDYVMEHRYTGDLDIQTERSMAKGWDKKVDLQEAKLQRELRYREVLQINQISG